VYKRQHKELTDSIVRFGLVDPLIVNTHKERKNILVGGHQRLKIAQELNIKEIPCVEVELNPDQEKELNIRLNKNSGEWNYDALANYFDVGELTEWGFTDDELQFYEEEPEQGLIDDDIPEVEEAITKQGDIWLLGEHRVLCGDATKKEDVALLMEGQKADMVFTDPPYGMRLDADYTSMNNRGKKYDNVIGDDDDFDPVFLMTLFDYCDEQFWWGADYYIERIPDRNNGNLFLWDKRLKSNNDGDKSSEFELCWMKQKHAREIFDFNWFRYFGLHAQDKNKRFHPTQKPIQVAEHLFKYGSEGDIVVDPFLGSGTTLIACEKTNRKCYGMEIDPHYCDVIVKRWEEYTGNKAERIEVASA
jgi:DNA modification methylase